MHVARRPCAKVFSAKSFFYANSRKFSPPKDSRYRISLEVSDASMIISTVGSIVYLAQGMGDYVRYKASLI